jgi:predicted dehydrogenase/threonine dehydrogenase-like Zn-dependent dehydrogenase
VRPGRDPYNAVKIVVQNFKTGALSVQDVPAPRPHPQGLLVRTRASLISGGTDRAIIALARKGYTAKAMDRPDLARKVLQKAFAEGFWATYKVVRNLIAEPIPLGYSVVGDVVAVARGVNGFAVGDRVACAGLGYANHAEMVAVPSLLCARVPAGVSDEQAAYVTLGATAMHGVRQADQQLGATVLVVGLGLVGQIAVQLCRAAGHRVIGLDVDPKKFEVARAGGALAVFDPHDSQVVTSVLGATRGLGVDAALLTAASRDSGTVFSEVPPLCRDRAKVVVVGDIKMEIPRRAYFEKELEILQSRSYGPGRYDPQYEEKGHDYPSGYVRWTEQRNIQAFLDLVGDGRVDMSRLTTHRFPIERATDAYALVTGENKTDETIIGVLLTYDGQSTAPPGDIVDHRPGASPRSRAAGDRFALGVIGTGQFGKAVLLPALLATHGFHVRGVASARGLSAEAVRARYGGDYATSEWERVVDDPTVETVVIATRHDSHAAIATAALERGKHVFVEKPLAITADDLQKVSEAARRSSGVLMVGYNRRFSPFVAGICRHFDGRAEPLAMVYRINAGRIPLKAEFAWVHDPLVGGGRIIGEACHFVDTLSAIADARPRTVRASGIAPNRIDLAGDDTVTIVISFDDGSLGTIHYFANGDAAFPKERLEVFGAERVAVLDNLRELELIAAGRRRRTRSFNANKGFAEEAAAFLDGCRTGRSPIALETLIDTTLVTLLAAEDLRNPSTVDAGDAERE